MQIALIHYSAPPIVGGVESVLAHQARLMANAGHAVRIVAARGAQTDARIPFVSVPLADSRHAALAPLKVELDAGRVPPDFERRVDELEQQLLGALRDVAVVIAHNVCSLNKNLALTAALHRVAQKPGAPRFILWHHDLAWTTPRYRSELHAGYPWNLLNTAWPGARQVVISELRRRELAELMHLAPETIAVIPNGLDVTRFFKLEPLTQTLVRQMQLLEAAPILLLPVRVTPRKNIELALHVLAALRREQLASAQLVVTGPLGPHNPANAQYFEQLKNLRAELGLEDAAHFLAELNESFLPDEVVADFYRLADALFLPSREEGFGLPVLEAAFSRLPMFCTDIPPLRALGGERATYFAPEAEPHAVAAQIQTRLAADDAYGAAVAARRTFTWERVYAEHLAPLLKET
ncbi:MAG: glycosyltransferase [Anaerolineales bacterium]|nr:glycosyltransferase [Anaerolineales bacterium]